MRHSQNEQKLWKSLAPPATSLSRGYTVINIIIVPFSCSQNHRKPSFSRMPCSGQSEARRRWLSPKIFREKRWSTLAWSGLKGFALFFAKFWGRWRPPISEEPPIFGGCLQRCLLQFGEDVASLAGRSGLRPAPGQGSKRSNFFHHVANPRSCASFI